MKFMIAIYMRIHMDLEVIIIQLLLEVKLFFNLRKYFFNRIITCSRIIFILIKFILIIFISLQIPIHLMT
jgi:hypothetical protein